MSVVVAMSAVMATPLKSLPTIRSMEGGAVREGETFGKGTSLYGVYLDAILASVDATHTHFPARRTHTSIQRNLPLVSFPR